MSALAVELLMSALIYSAQVPAQDGADAAGFTGCEKNIEFARQP
jgi:hypothetical protein